MSTVNVSTSELKALVDQHKHSMDSNPAVYVGTYGKYNNGSIYGMWIDLTTFYDYDDFVDFCHQLHHDEDDPEFMIQDFENFPSAWYCESMMDEDTFDKIKEFGELDDDEQEAYKSFLYWFNDKATWEEARDRWMGDFDSEEDYAWSIFEMDLEHSLPEVARRYFDIKAYARDLFIDDYFFDDGHVFTR